MPHFFDGEEDLRKRWSEPETRQQLLDLLERSGFQEDKLETVRRILEMEKCDMLDLLSFLAYETTPMERQRRAEIVQQDAEAMDKKRRDFLNFILQMYVHNGFKELGMDKLSTLIDMKYHSMADAKKQLAMQPAEIRAFFLDLQQKLYNGNRVINLTINNHYHGSIDNLNIQGD